ncbi:MAG: M20 family peptidase [Candidatus Kapabacteria bacterium]|nr:M20 family peptidase [Candidatus Kapabacteria bacterium]MDW8224663.1 M20 family peptidase [Bacteroidota bacterium]
MRRIVLTALIAAGALGVLSAVVVYRTLRLTSAPEEPPLPMPQLAVDSVGVLERFAAALRYRTISHQDTSRVEHAEFERFHEFLYTSFPEVHRRLSCERVGGYSVLYRWQGSDTALPAVLLMGHMDVVPVEPGTEGNWRYPPFSGTIAEGYVWGRGAIDDKITVMGILEAVEMLLRQGFQPTRDVYIAFGHDEEVGGAQGARQIVALLQQRGVRIDWIMDEGGAVTVGMLPGVERPVAMVGVAEKGYMMVELSASGRGGHSSTPPTESPLGMVAAAVAAVERSPMPARLEGAAAAMLDAIAPEMPFWQRMLVANRWLFGNLLLRQLQQTPRGNATVRTTFAPTIFHAGVKENVIPSTAQAAINVRLLPGDTPEEVVEHLRRVISHRGVQIAVQKVLSVPSPVADVHSRGFRVIQGVARSVFPEARVVPYLVLGATDSRHYTVMTPNIFRFLPVRLTPEEYQTFHGADERLRVGEVLSAVRFYAALIYHAAGEVGQ